MKDICSQAESFHGVATVHPSDFVADVRVAICETRRQAEGAAGETRSTALHGVLALMEDLDTVCAKYLNAVMSWHAVATEAELGAVNATADACAAACVEEYHRRSARVLASCRDTIRRTLEGGQPAFTVTAGGGRGQDEGLFMSPEIREQRARAAFEVLRSRAAFELADMELCVYGSETPWHSTLQSSGTLPSPPPTNPQSGNGRTTTGM